MFPTRHLRSTGRGIALVAAALQARLLPMVARARARLILRRSGLFDPAFYAAHNHVGPFKGTEAALNHYLSRGAAADLRPHPGFDPLHYRAAAAERGRSVGNPLLHYLLVGSRLGIAPSADFDPVVYRRENPDVTVERYEPFGHAVRFGAADRRGAAVPLDAPGVVDLAPPHPIPDGPVVDVVVPVYRGLEDALRTLHSVLAAWTEVAYELVVIDDASPEPEVSAALDELAAAGRITLLRNEENRGFVASVNRGMALHPDRDVVLLNADTAVFDHWLERLVAPLAQGRIGTVTPFSNAATIFSYPIRLRDNRGALEVSFAEFDRICAAQPAEIVDVPTGVGFCMAIARACLAEVGAFDEVNFGRGYGEENDFCCRAAKAGWRNVATTDLFVWHRGGGSFGVERAERVAHAQRTLARLHPGYAGAVGDFIRHDPLRPAREALDVARITRVAKPRAFVVGGARDRLDDRFLWIELVPDIGPRHGALRLVPRDFGATPNLPRLTAETTTADLERLVERLGVVSLIVRDGEAIDPELRRRLADAVRRKRRAV